MNRFRAAVTTSQGQVGQSATVTVLTRVWTPLVTQMSAFDRGHPAVVRLRNMPVPGLERLSLATGRLTRWQRTDVKVCSRVLAVDQTYVVREAITYQYHHVTVCRSVWLQNVLRDYLWCKWL